MKKNKLKVPSLDSNIGSEHSLQRLLNAVNGLLKVDCPIWVIICRHYYVNGCVSSKVSSITGTNKLNLYYLENT